MLNPRPYTAHCPPLSPPEIESGRVSGHCGKLRASFSAEVNLCDGVCSVPFLLYKLNLRVASFDRHNRLLGLFMIFVRLMDFTLFFQTVHRSPLSFVFASVV